MMLLILWLLLLWRWLFVVVVVFVDGAFAVVDNLCLRTLPLL